MVEFIVENWLQLVTLLANLGVVKVIYNLYTSRSARHEAMYIGIKTILRTNIISTCINAERKGYLPLYDVENLNDMYSAYSALGGNGAVKELYQSTLRLPHTKPEEE